MTEEQNINPEPTEAAADAAEEAAAETEAAAASAEAASEGAAAEAAETETATTAAGVGAAATVATAAADAPPPTVVTTPPPPPPPPPTGGAVEPPAPGSEGGFWATASGGVKAAIIIGVVLLIGLLLWGLVSMLGNNGNAPATPVPEITTIPTTAPPTAEAGQPALTATRDTAIYAGPGADYPQLGTLQSGLSANVVGKNQDGSWWAIDFPNGPNGVGWVPNGDVRTTDVNNVPVLQAPPLPTPTPTATPLVITDWKGEYFDNPDVKDKPVLVRNDRDINFDWGTGAPAPGLPTDNYSVRWSRKADFDNSDYQFTVNLEGGVRLWLDGRLLIDDWVASGNRTVQGSSGPISAGPHDLRVDYFKSGGVGRISVSWAPVKVIPPQAIIDLPSQQIVVGEPAQFRGDRSTAYNGHQIVSYAWDFGNGLTSNLPNPEVTFSRAGAYRITLTVTDDQGQQGVTSVDVQVADKATMTPTATPTATATPVETPTPAPTATATPVADDLINITWTMTAMTKGKGAPQQALPTPPVTLLLTPKGAYNGAYSGNGGCNTYQGEYNILGAGQIEFLAMSQSSSLCSQDIMDQETQYFTMLVNMTQYSVSGDQMTLSNNTGDAIDFVTKP